MADWKVGDEFAPYHPQASHVNPDWRDGWNACHTQAAALLRQQAERIVELEAAQAGIIQAITDPENQPSQYGTVTIDMHDEDGFVIERMGQLLAETVLILRGPPPKLTRWSYHDIPERVATLAAERDTLREAITATLTEHAELADGDDCTLILLKQAIEAKAYAAGAQEVEALRAEVERLQDTITGFCNGQKWAVDAWKNAKHNKPLFDAARAIEAAKEAK